MSYKTWKHKERYLVKKLLNHGIKCHRVPLSRNVVDGTSEDIVCTEHDLLIDVQSTIAQKQITVKREKLEKIQRGADFHKKMGCVIFNFKYDKNDYVILNLKDFVKLLKL